jgi:serine/threonine protein kinase
MSCPTREQLGAFQRRELAADQWQAIDRHVEECSSCAAVLAAFQEESRRHTDRIPTVASAAPFAEQSAGTSAYEARDLPAAEHTRASSQTTIDPAAAPLAPSALPEDLGPYKILRELGHGGMGAVYEARHARLKRRVALKVLAEDRINDSQAMARFDREMEALGALAHPNIVSATDADEDQGHHYLVMEYVEGVNLALLVHLCGPLAVADAAELIRQAAAGLQYAHEHDLVHRDIKPGNLMLSFRGEVKVLDLGLALLRAAPAAGAELTVQGQMMGTADYAAPEQWLDCHGVDIRADIYSLGCTLYKLLSGAAPFSGPAYETAYRKRNAHLNTPPPPLTQRSDVPEALQAILMRMLAKDPDHRFATPGEVADALQPFAAGANLPGLIATVQAQLARQTSTTPAQRSQESPAALTPASVPELKPVRSSTGESVTRARVRRLPRWAYAVLGMAAAGLLVLAGYFLAGHSPKGPTQETSARKLPGGWRPLPDGDPIALTWPEDGHGSRWYWHPEEAELHVSCRGSGLLVLGETDEQNYKVEVSIYQTQWGGAGIFFGAQPATWNGKPSQQYQLIQLRIDESAGKQPAYLLEWSVCQSPVNGGGGTRTDPALASLPEFGNQDQRLTLTVADNVVSNVAWNGVDLMSRFRATPAVGFGTAKLKHSCRGAFGVYCGNTTVFFRVPRFLSYGDS